MGFHSTFRISPLPPPPESHQLCFHTPEYIFDWYSLKNTLQSTCFYRYGAYFTFRHRYTVFFKYNVLRVCKHTYYNIPLIWIQIAKVLIRIHEKIFSRDDSGTWAGTGQDDPKIFRDGTGRDTRKSSGTGRDDLKSSGTRDAPGSRLTIPGLINIWIILYFLFSRINTPKSEINPQNRGLALMKSCDT